MDDDIRKPYKSAREMHKTDILDFISRKLAPYILLFGFYLISHGHLSPGGGFQGGVVLASGIILLTLGKGVQKIEALFPVRKVALVEAGAFLMFLGIGFGGILNQGRFLENFLSGTGAAAGSGLSTGTIFSIGTFALEIPGVSFIFFLNIIIGLKVGAGISLICLYLFRED